MARLVFECEDGDGDLVFFETSEKEAKDLAATYEASKKWLLESGFTLMKASARKPKGNGKVHFDGRRCPKCSGAVWDNRSKKAEDSSRNKWPDFSCKDKSGCQWAVWPGQYELIEETA
jgi:hypothetical protein